VHHGAVAKDAHKPELTPPDEGTPRHGPYGHAAGGLDAVRSTVAYTAATAGLARGVRALLRVNQTEGFDCPSCAWPDPEHRATVEFCENGARAVADEVTRRRVTPEFFAQWSIARLAEQSDAWLNAQGRLTHPMVRDEGAAHYRPISWEETFARLGLRLRSLEHPDRAVFYTSGRTSNEAAFLYQLLARVLGTNNLPDCSNMCHESSGVGLGESIGIGKGTVTLADFSLADAIFVIGQNPGTNHPRMLSALREAKLRGCKIVAINPLREAGLVRFAHPQKLRDLAMGGVELTDLSLRVRVGGDIALLKGIMKAMLEAERERPGEGFDHAFIEEHTVGYSNLVADLDATSWPEIEAGAGVPLAEIQAAAAIALSSRATIATWAMGLTQHRHGVANVQTVVNFLLLRGNLGRPGAGVCPVRGHSNVQGDRTMGICERPPAWTGALEQAFGFSAPREPGFDTVGAIEAMHRGSVDVFFALGGNFLSATPDTLFTAEALRRCQITAHVSTKLNRAHLVTGREAFVLPCLGRTEADLQGGVAQFVTVENSMGIVHRSTGRLPPASQDLLSETRILARLAEATFGASAPVPWSTLADDYGNIRAAIERVIPGFDRFAERVAVPGGFALPNRARERSFATPTGKAAFVVHAIPQMDLPSGQLWMTTVRSHDQFNTTIYGDNDRYRGIWGQRRVVLMHEADMADRSLREGDTVIIRSHFGGERREAKGFRALRYDIPRGSVATYFPEANVLVPLQHHADGSRTPASKAVAVTVECETADG